MASTRLVGVPNLPMTAVSICPTCGHRVAVRMFDGLDLSRIDREAAATPPILRCVACGGVSAGLNPPPQPSAVLAARSPSQDRHDGAAIDLIEQRVGDQNFTVIEIGHGHGAWLRTLAARMPAAEFIGFDARVRAASGLPNVNLRAARFEPLEHLAQLRPDMVLIRDLSDCGDDPAALLHMLAFAVTWHGVNPLVYFGAACTDRVVEDLQTTGLARAEWRGFTTSAFRHLLQAVGLQFDTLGHTPDHQMIFAVGHIAPRPEWLDLARAGASFALAARTKSVTIQAQIAALAGLRIALWGEPTHSQAFLAQYWPDPWPQPRLIRRLQEIEPGGVDVVIAADHRATTEADEQPAAAVTLLVEYRGRLIDFHHDVHPYRARPDRDDLRVIPA
jgi:hypothetical protein